MTAPKDQTDKHYQDKEDPPKAVYRRPVELTEQQQVDRVVEILRRDLPDEIFASLLQRLGVPNKKELRDATNWRPWIEKKIEDGRLHIRVHEGEEPKVLMLDPTMSATIEAICVPGLETSVSISDADQRIADLKRENYHLKLRLEAAEVRLNTLDPAVD